MERVQKIILPSVVVIIAASIGLWSYKMTDDYMMAHVWTAMLPLIALILGIWGVGRLIWGLSSNEAKSRLLCGLGVAVMLIAWIGGQSVSGVIVGAVMTLIGFTLIVRRPAA